MTRRAVSVRWPLGADRSAVVGLLAASLAFYYPLVFLGRALVDYDAFVYFYPQRVYLAESLLAGRIPLWDPDLFLGVPFLANPQTAVLYPPSWLFLLGPVQVVYAAQLVLRAPGRSPLVLAWCAVGGGVMCALGASLAAAQLLPTLELAPLSIRGDGVDWRDAVAGSLPPYLAVRALLPPYWIRVPYTEYLGYVGVAPIALGLLAVLFGHWRAVVFAAAISFLGLFLALGEDNGWYGRVFSSLSRFETFP